MDLDYQDLRSPEFQAVIIVDYDDGRLFPLTENTPKCLLPIANRKLLAYQLDMLAKSGVVETFVVAPVDFEVRIRQFLEESHRDTMKVELIIAAEMSGTADGLRAVAERIRGDFIYISADIISQFGLIDLVNLHRSSVSDMTILFSVPTNKESIKDDVDQEYIGITKEGRVLLKSSTLELEDEGITLSKALLFKASSPLSVRNDLMDVGVYIFSYWILEFIKSTKRISSIKSDLLPYLIHRQFQSQEYLYEKFPSLQFRKRPLNYLENWLIQNNNSSTSSEHHWNNNQIPAGNSYQTISDYEKNYLKLSNNDCLRCFGLIYGNSSNNTNDTTAGSNTAPSFMLSRVHTIPTYLTLNKEMPLLPHSSRTPWPRLKNFFKKEMSLIGEHVEMGENIAYRQCFIGNNCKIGNRTKLNNCVIMDGVVIGDNCIVQNSVICERVVIENNCNLNECNIGMCYKVTQGIELRGESLATGSV